MNDKELADKIVALGVGEGHRPNLPKSDQTYWYPAHHYPDEPMGEDEFVRDWRVAGAMMEECTKREYEVHIGYWVSPYCDVRCIFPEGRYLSQVKNESLPRAINEACAEALS